MVRASPRRAFTLLELLVVVALLAGLLLGAIQKVRTTAACLRCTGHLRQLRPALHHAHDAGGSFPANGGYDGRQTIPDVTGKPVTVVTIDHVSGTRTWRVGDPGRSPADQPGSWVYGLLPSVRQDATCSARAWQTLVARYVCQVRKARAAVPGDDDRARYLRGGRDWAKIDYAGHARPFAGWPARLTLADVTDGSAHTVLAGEKAVDLDYALAGSWYWDESYFLGGSESTVRKGNQTVQDWRKAFLEIRENWGSGHPGGVNFLMVDGSVRHVRFPFTQQRLLALLTPAGGKAAPDV